MRAIVRPGDLVVDVGANTGIYAYQLARLVGPRGAVHAIEPDPASVARLEALRRAQPNITVHAVAASDRSGTGTLHVPLFGGKRLGALASVSLPQGRAPDYETVSIRLAPIDQILPASGAVAFIKVDVEGHETSVLRGAQATLRRSLPPLLIEIEQRHQQADIRRTFDDLTALGYKGYAAHARGLRPLDEFDLDRDQLAHITGDFVPGAMPPEYVHDFLFVRPGEDVRALLAPA